MSRRSRRRPAKQQSLVRLPIVAGVVGVAIVAALFVIYLSRGSAPVRPPVVVQEAAYEGLAVSGRTLGPESAPITVVEYSDFQCPYCRRASEEILPRLKAEYVKSGVVRYEYHPVAFIGNESQRAAEAAMCAEDQGEFFQYHDALWLNQRGENLGAFSDANLKRIAGEVGLDQGAFGACLDSGRHRSDVQQATEEATSRGVRAVPTFFINDSRVDGAVPWSEFRALIESKRR